MQQACRAARLIFLAFGLGVASWAPMVPYAKTRIQLDDAELGLTLLVLGIGALVSMPLAGWLVNRLGSRVVTLVGGLGVVTLLPLLTLLQTPFSLSVGLFLFGTATGAVNIAINAQAVALEAKNARPIMSGLHCLYSTGGLLGVTIMSVLLAYGLPLFICALFVSVVLFLIMVSQWKNLLPLAANRTSKGTQNGSIWPDNKVIFLGLLCFIAFMAEGSMLDWSAEFLRSSLDYQAALAGMGYALFSISMALGRLAGDRLIHRFGVLNVFQIGNLLAACGFLLVVKGWGYSEGLGFCLIGLGAANSVPILFTTSGRLSTTSANYALTFITSFGYGGLLLGPAFIGFIANLTTLAFALGGMAGFLIAIALAGKFVILVPRVNAEIL